ncbi:MAG: LysR substrate-binding domain-containing protein, partial [Pseudomonadota bacterium]
LDPFLSSDHASHFTVNNYFGVLQAVLHGLGIGALPDYVTVDTPNLVNVVPAQSSAVVPVYLAYPEELRHSKRVAAFRDFVLEEIGLFKKSQREAATA